LPAGSSSHSALRLAARASGSSPLSCSLRLRFNIAYGAADPARCQRATFLATSHKSCSKGSSEEAQGPTQQTHKRKAPGKKGEKGQPAARLFLIAFFAYLINRGLALVRFFAASVLLVLLRCCPCCCSVLWLLLKT
jgi:hypothetical protein